MVMSNNDFDALRAVERAIMRKDVRGFPSAVEDFLQTPVTSSPLQRELGQYDPTAVYDIMGEIHRLRQAWPHMVGQNLRSIGFAHNADKPLISGTTRWSTGESPFDVTLFSDLLHGARTQRPEGWSGPLGGLDEVLHVPRHEIGHGIWNQLLRLGTGREERLDLPLGKAVEGQFLAKQLLDSLENRVPYELPQIVRSPEGPAFAVNVPNDIANISGYAAHAYPNDVIRFRQAPLRPVLSLHEPFAETFANLEAATAPHTVNRIGPERLLEGSNRLGESGFTRDVLRFLPQIQDEVGAVKPSSLAAGLGLAALPLAAMAVPKARNFIERGMIGAQIGGIPGAIAGVASQLIPGLHS